MFTQFIRNIHTLREVRSDWSPLADWWYSLPLDLALGWLTHTYCGSAGYPTNMVKTYVPCPITTGVASNHIRKNAKSRLAASGAQGARDVTMQTWRARAPLRSLGGDFQLLGALLASGDTENSTVPSWTFALALVTSEALSGLRAPRAYCQGAFFFVRVSRVSPGFTIFSSDASLFGGSIRLRAFLQTLRYLGRAFGVIFWVLIPHLCHPVGLYNIAFAR